MTVILIILASFEGQAADQALEAYIHNTQRAVQALKTVFAEYRIYEADIRGQRYGLLDEFVYVAFHGSNDGRLFREISRQEDGVAWERHSKRQRAYYGDSTLVFEFPRNRSFQLMPLSSDERPFKLLGNDNYFVLAGIWPFGECPKWRDSEPFMVNDLQAEMYAYCGATTVEGVVCDIFERPGFDKIWISRDGRMMRREICSEPSGPLFQILQYGAHVQITDDLYLPQEISVTTFDLVGQSAKKEHRIRVEVTSLLSNANAFPMRQFKIRPGMVELTSDSELGKQVSPGGLDMVDDLVEWAKAVGHKPPPRNRIASSITIVVSVLVMLVLFESVVFRRISVHPGFSWVAITGWSTAAFVK